jgi:hypothetical protein
VCPADVGSRDADAANVSLRRWPLSKRVNSSRTPDDYSSLIEKLQFDSGNFRDRSHHAQAFVNRDRK